MVAEGSMTAFLDLLGILRCPMCPGAALTHTDNAFRCDSCGSRYGLSAGVLVMTKEARAHPNSPLIAREREDWERNADFYLREVHSPLYKLLNRSKVETYGLHREERRFRILDLGGGTGHFSMQMASWGHVPITLDFAARMLQLGKEAYGLPLPIQCISPPIPFCNESFDAVVTNGVLHHCKGEQVLPDIVREIHRVLKPRGLLLVYDRNGAFLGRQLHHSVMRIKSALQRKWHFAGSSSSDEPDFNESDLRSILDAGFEIERRRYVSTIPTFVAIVLSNAVEYVGLGAASHLLRNVFSPLAAAAESVLPFKPFTVEQCIRLVKTQPSPPTSPKGEQ